VQTTPMRFASLAIVIAVVPALALHSRPQSQTASVQVEARQVVLRATITKTQLDLRALSLADFGDAETY
jgi:hypothetical protein